jgi:indole-3-glycerol phosphate synthase
MWRRCAHTACTRFLVGESLMRAPDPGERLRELFGT